MLYVILIVILLAFVSVSNFIASRNMERESDAIVHDSIPISNTANSLLKDLINQETGIRGFELSGNEQYLEPYTSGKKQLEVDLNTINHTIKNIQLYKSLWIHKPYRPLHNLQKYFRHTIGVGPSTVK